MVLKEIVDYGVIGVLVFMSVIAVGIAIERWIFFKRVRLNSFKTRQELEIALTRGLHIIAIVGANAPYVGLLGTVLGIMLTFYTIGSQGFVDTRRIMVGLALALKATAAGLLVAIPAVILYNLLLRKVKVFLALWEADVGRKGI